MDPLSGSVDDRSFSDADRFNEQLQKQGYQAVSVLGKGGTGTVWMATDTRLNRQVAIKLLGSGEQFQNKILSEARLLANFNHPHIVQIYDILPIEDDSGSEKFAIVMEYIKGRHLLSWQQEHLPGNVEKLTLLLQVAHTLAYIHQRGIVHGDLKPANLLLRSEKSGAPQCVITDFGEGFSKIQQGNGTLHSTQYWSAPEVLNSGERYQSGDIYSFGLLLLWLLTGWHPGESVRGFNLSESDHVNFTNKLSAFNSALPAEILPLLQKLLRWDPHQRIADISLVSLELEQILKREQQRQILDQETHPVDTLSTATTVPEKPAEDGLAQDHKVSTSMIVTPKSLFKGFHALVAVVIAIGVLLTAAGWHIFHQQTPPKFIALLPPQISGKLDETRQQLLVSAVTHAIENNIINRRNFLLIPAGDIRSVIAQANALDSDAINLTSAVGDAMGASDVISVDLDCSVTHCDVALSRSVKATGNDKWSVSASDRFSTPLSENLYFSDAIAQRFPRLFEETEALFVGTQRISELAYTRYLEISTEFTTDEGNGNLDHLLVELQSLISAYPEFHSWYWLFIAISRKAHTYSEDMKYFDAVSTVLRQSPRQYRDSAIYQVDDFWLNIYRSDFTAAQNRLVNMESLGFPFEELNYYQSILAFKEQDFAKSIDLLQQLQKYNKSSTVLHNLALSYWYDGDIHQAIAILKDAIEINPYFIDLQQLLGSAQLIAGQLEQATNTYQHILNRVESSHDLSNLSIVKTLQGQYQEAEHYAQKAVKLNPENPNWILNYADILKLNGFTSLARQQYQKALALLPDDSELYNRLIAVQALAHLSHIDEAINQIESIKKDFPQNGYVFFTAALVYTLLERHNLALFHVNEALELNFDAIWFSLPWFAPLCENLHIKSKITGNYASVIC